MKKLIKLIEIIRLKTLNPYQRATYIKKNMGIEMGDSCQVFGNVGFGSEPYLIKIGDKVKITAGTQFITHDGGMEVLRNLDLLPEADYFGRIVIGNNVFIGNKCIIMPGVTIGDNVVVGAGSIVTRDIPSNSVCAGVPAKVLRSIEEYYEKYKDQIDNTKNYSREEKQKYLEEKYGIRR